MTEDNQKEIIDETLQPTEQTAEENEFDDDEIEEEEEDED